MVMTITGSVGLNAKNQPKDVLKIQKLLNRHISLLANVNQLAEDGLIGDKTIRAIQVFQAQVLKLSHPDGRVDTNGATLFALNETIRESASGPSISTHSSSRPDNVAHFIDYTLASAKRIKQQFGIPVSITIAQAALETGWGKHVKENAYFGIKAHNSAGATTSFNTTEFIDGQRVSINDSFRAYDNFGDAAQDYGLFLTTNPRYKNAFSYTNQPEKFAEQLQLAGYATDPEYAQKLKSIINRYNLEALENA